jgi:hypothetical protein
MQGRVYVGPPRRPVLFGCVPAVGLSTEAEHMKTSKPDNAKNDPEYREQRAIWMAKWRLQLKAIAMKRKRKPGKTKAPRDWCEKRYGWIDRSDRDQEDDE